MFISPKIATCSILHMVKMSAFPSRNNTIGFAPAFSVPNMSLLMNRICRFYSREFTTGYALMNSCSLVGLSLIYTWSLGFRSYDQAKSDTR
jgi:hypothetical protein